MLLTINLNNTNTLFGLYDGTTLVNHWRIKTDKERMPDEYGLLVLSFFEHSDLDPAEVKGICLGSVVPPLTRIFTRMCERYFHTYPLLVSHELNTGVKVLIDNPDTIGADRLVNAIAACQRYGGPACIVDLGTATTLDAISEEGDYLGGAIVPGITIAADALFSRTAKLPRVELTAPPSVVGRNTVHAIQSGLLYGYVSLIEGMVTRFRAELGESMKVIATGGLVGTFSELTDVIDYIDPWLTLEGLRLFWDLNRDQA
jgi:type III pantothenate kinase